MKLLKLISIIIIGFFLVVGLAVFLLDFTGNFEKVMVFLIGGMLIIPMVALFVYLVVKKKFLAISLIIYFFMVSVGFPMLLLFFRDSGNPLIDKIADFYESNLGRWVYIFYFLMIVFIELLLRTKKSSIIRQIIEIFKEKERKQ